MAFFFSQWKGNVPFGLNFVNTIEFWISFVWDCCIHIYVLRLMKRNNSKNKSKSHDSKLLSWKRKRSFRAIIILLVDMNDWLHLLRIGFNTFVTLLSLFSRQVTHENFISWKAVDDRYIYNWFICACQERSMIVLHIYLTKRELRKNMKNFFNWIIRLNRPTITIKSVI